MGTPASALGAAGGVAGGAANLITAVGSLLPTTQSGKYENSGTASSDTLNTQFQADLSNTEGSETSKGTKNTKNNTSNSGSETNKTSQVSNDSQKSTQQSVQQSIQHGIQQFSGAQNTSTEQTMLSDDAVIRIVNLMLQGNGSVPGLQETVSGERNAGVFNASTTQLMVDNLMSNIGGEVAKMTAPKVTSDNLGASSTATNNTTDSTTDNNTNTNTNTVSNTIANILSNLNQSSTGSEDSTNQTDITQQVLNALLGVGTQNTEQENASKGTSKTKTSKGCNIFSMLAGSLLLGHAGINEPDTLRYARDTWLIPQGHYNAALYGKRNDSYLYLMSKTPESRVNRLSLDLNRNYIDPMTQAIKDGDMTKFHKIYVAWQHKIGLITGVV